MGSQDGMNGTVKCACFERDLRKGVIIMGYRLGASCRDPGLVQPKGRDPFQASGRRASCREGALRGAATLLRIRSPADLQGQSRRPDTLTLLSPPRWASRWPHPPGSRRPGSTLGPCTPVRLLGTEEGGEGRRGEPRAHGRCLAHSLALDRLADAGYSPAHYCAHQPLRAKRIRPGTFSLFQ